MRGTAVASDAPGLEAKPLVAGDSYAAHIMTYFKAHRARIHRRAMTFTEYSIARKGKIPAHPAFFITDTTNKNFHEHEYSPVYGKYGVPANPDIVVKQGTVEEWYLINAGIGDHTFHIHHMSFVLETGPNG